MNIPILVYIFLPCFLLGIFYWEVAHPTFMTWMRYRLFARRDALRRLAIDGKEDMSSASYRTVEEFICKTLSVVPSINLWDFSWFFLMKRKEIVSSKIDLIAVGSVQMRDFRTETMWDGLCIMLTNSPVIMLAMPVIVAMLICAALSKRVIEHGFACFIEKLPEGQHFAVRTA